MSEAKNGDGNAATPKSDLGSKHGMRAHRIPGDTLEDREPYLRAVAQRIIEMRRLRSMSQVQMAAAAGLGMASVHHIESAKSNSTILTIRRVAQALGCNAGDLLPDETTMSKIEVQHKERM